MSKSCSSCNKKNRCGVTLFNFPKKDTQRSKWIEFVNKPYWLPNVSSRLCSDHFDEADILRRPERVRLAPNAIPRGKGLFKYWVFHKNVIKLCLQIIIQRKEEKNRRHKKSNLTNFQQLNSWRYNKNLTFTLHYKVFNHMSYQGHPGHLNLSLLSKVCIFLKCRTKDIDQISIILYIKGDRAGGGQGGLGNV